MGICREFCEMVEELIEDLDDVFEGTCLAGRNKAAPTQTPEPGDIIGVDRGIYQHYGIYAGDDRVIHYTAETSDIDPENAEIQETSLERFLRDETEFFILEPGEAERDENGIFGEAPGGYRSKKKHGETAEEAYPYFSPEETLARAHSRIGEHKYNLLANNCEHFVVWCRTGVSESRQVRQWMTLCRRILAQAGYAYATDEDA